MPFAADQMSAIEITERVCSILSILGATFIITTFLFDRSFHNPINRLVFYAAWGNIMSNVGTLISISGIHLGVHGPLCQFQAFLVQWFMPADALWTFAMALNVYLTFFRKFDQYQLRSLEWKYLIFCYGIPFIPAFVFFFIKTEARGKVYGSAVLWCWISLEWDVLRVAVFYGPVWLVIFTTFAIYVVVGRVVFRWRRELLRFAENRTLSSDISVQTQFMSPGITKTTEIRITTEAAHSPDTDHELDFSEDFSKPVQSNWVRPASEPTSWSRQQSRNRRPSHVNIDANRAAISYCKCALLFFVALLVTWVPSTINRVVTLVNPEDEVFGLAYTSGLVLPLQGFWNTIIYITTSLHACKALKRRIAARFTRPQNTAAPSTKRTSRFSTPVDMSNSAGRGSKKQQTADSESLEELRAD